MAVSLDFDALRAAYREGLTPSELVRRLHLAANADQRAVWIHVLPLERLEAMAAAVEAQVTEELPLYGVPFAVKDNIDVAGAPTTAACPDYSYTPTRSAAVVERLMAAGAIPLGKANLDQFATGLNGTRSPYGTCRNAFNPEYISGGSSSGSAVSVALGQVSFALGTDTAGSGRVPAALNNIVGLKPSCGALSARGVVPACRTLDSVTILALTARDAARVLGVVAAEDPEDPYSRPLGIPVHPIPAAGAFRFGVPDAKDLNFFGDQNGNALFTEAAQRLAAAGATPVAVDLAPFLEAARLLYGGPWVAERYAAIADFIEKKPESLLPVTRGIILGGKKYSAVDAFMAFYQLQALRKTCDRAWAIVDVILTPTAGRHYTIAEIQANPIAMNTELGYYTNFMNLLDYAAVAVPAAFGPDGLPFGVTLFAPRNADHDLLRIADVVQSAARLPLGATGVPFPGP